MANNNKLDEMIRPRSIYLTSEMVAPDADASSAIYQLRETVFAMDGHDLVFGVRSFGFNASATNISRIQNNNTLRFQIIFNDPKYVPTSDESDFILNSNRLSNRVQIFTVTYPDGLYTLDELFAMLSSRNNYAIKSGYKYDVLNDDTLFVDYETGKTFENDVYITFNFESIDGGFKVIPEFKGAAIKNRYENVNGTSFYSAYNVNPVITSLSIIRDQYSEGLFDLLFTNKFSDSLDHPGVVPQYETNLRGANPPTSINFDTMIRLYDNSLTPDEPEYLSTVHVQSSAVFYRTYTTPDTTLIEQLNEKYPSQGFKIPNRGAVFYHKPLITPMYIDVESDLETYNITTEGNLKGLLVRQFALGTENGGTSFFQSYDNPVFFKMSSSRESIDSVRISFRAEGNKWNFFNMEFFLELLIFEYPKESLRRAMMSQQMSMGNGSGNESNREMVRASDEVTAAMGPLHNSFPFRHRGNDASVVYFRDLERTSMKRRFE